METIFGGNQQASAVVGTNNRLITNEGQLVVDALKAFIVPIVKNCLAAKDINDASPMPAPTDNRDDVAVILSALTTFVGHVVEVEIACRDKDVVHETECGTERRDSLAAEKEDLIVAATPSERDWEVAYRNAALLLDRTPKSAEKRANRMMERLRKIIFNRWPIRVLWFGRPGSVKLIGQGDVYSILHANLCDDLQREQTCPDLRRAINKRLKYAILSHTWLQDSPGEITYKSWVEGSYDRNSAGYQKLESFCRVSTDHGLQFGWMDTLCINKDSSSELDESIRSMYRWYRNSGACITYLAETSRIGDMHNDRWFKRGWTLQELVAPQIIFFYNSNWERLTTGQNDRKHKGIAYQIEQGSQITPEELDSFHTKRPHISRRMQWAAGREVTREEDTAYSLMGLFGVSMSTAYGEGAEQAFARLIKKIISNPGQDTVAMDIANCIPNSNRIILNSSILPYGPGAFKASAPPRELWQGFEPHIPMIITQHGLHVSALLIRGIRHSMSEHPQYTWVHTSAGAFRLLRHPFESKNGSFAGIWLAVLNHTVKNNNIFLPPTCLAVRSQVLVNMHSSSELEIPTDGSTFGVNANELDTPTDWSTFVLDYDYNYTPITFSLTESVPSKQRECIPIADLEQNGLYLRTLYL